MRARSRLWNAKQGWVCVTEDASFDAKLILAFGGGTALSKSTALSELQRVNPNAIIASVSTAGEIANDLVMDDSVVALEMEFEHTNVQAALVAIDDGESSEHIAERLVAGIDQRDLAHVLVFSDGLSVNGSALASGLSARLAKHVAVTGGLAADGDRFECTYVGLGTTVATKQVVAVALYGDKLRVGFGSVGGWNAFGPERLITRSDHNVLYALDNEPALKLYKRYLGDAVAELPASALLFPLALSRSDGTAPLVRTILAVNEDEGTMTFAGDVPEGAHVQLMRASFDGLVDGAEQAATNARTGIGTDASVAILVSCVGRRLVMKQSVEDELEGVRRVLGDTPLIAGFYSYGEITPLELGGRCELHNQTMTITTLAEC